MLFVFIHARVEVMNLKRAFNLTPTVTNKLCTHIFFGSWFQYKNRQIIPRHPIISILVCEMRRRMYTNSKISEMQEKDKEFAKSKGIQVVMNFETSIDGVGMGPAAISEVARNESLRSELVSKLADLVKLHNFNGIFFKWHFPYKQSVKIYYAYKK